ncbi:MAG: hypothetical protein FD166_3643 [Bacteroidetes bacterium]|nr:MAG: hypothetical protein FD166_3643 [Bacteroidota bacterium]
MKRQKNYRQLRSKSSARNKLNEIKSRAVAPDTRHSGATVNGANNSLFSEYTEKPAYGEPPEDRFANMPLPDFQFNWDEEFFGTASPGNNGLTETIAFESPAVEKEPVAIINEDVKQDTDLVILEDLSAVNIAEPVEPAPAATVETKPEPVRPATVTAAPARFVSVKRQMALAAREAEKMRNPAEKVRTGENKLGSTKPAGKQGVIRKTVLKKADSSAGKKVQGVVYGLPAKFGQSTVINKVERALAAIQKPATGISGVGKKSETLSLSVRRVPSFRSFVISTIQRLMEQQRFLALERESSRFLAREPGTGKKEEPAVSDISAQEKIPGGTTRWNNPLIAAASTGLAHQAGAKGQKSKSALPGETETSAGKL